MARKFGISPTRFDIWVMNLRSKTNQTARARPKHQICPARSDTTDGKTNSATIQKLIESKFIPLLLSNLQLWIHRSSSNQSPKAREMRIFPSRQCTVKPCHQRIGRPRFSRKPRSSDLSICLSTGWSTNSGNPQPQSSGTC